MSCWRAERYKKMMLEKLNNIKRSLERVSALCYSERVGFIFWLIIVLDCMACFFRYLSEADGTMSIKNNRELEFVIFCIENVAAYLQKDAREIYDMLTQESDILNTYIVPEYEMLHTQSKEYIVGDIVDVLKERGLLV